MKKSLIVAAVGVCAFALGLSANFAMSDITTGYKVAVVDVPELIQGSAQVQALVKDQQKQLTDLKTFIEKAQADITKQTDETKRKALEDKYNKELRTKQETIQKNYETKRTAIEKQITGVITKQAQTDKYDLVLLKNVVIYGGSDITATVKPNVK